MELAVVAEERGGVGRQRPMTSGVKESGWRVCARASAAAMPSASTATSARAIVCVIIPVCPLLGRLMARTAARDSRRLPRARIRRL